VDLDCGSSVYSSLTNPRNRQISRITIDLSGQYPLDVVRMDMNSPAPKSTVETEML
jgi:hypothetical protein